MLSRIATSAPQLAAGAAVVADAAREAQTGVAAQRRFGSARWHRCGVGAPLLLIVMPSAAAGLVGRGMTTSIGLALALWATLLGETMPAVPGDVLVCTLGGAMVGTAGWVWRLSAVRSRGKVASVRRKQAQKTAALVLPGSFDRAQVLGAARERFLCLQAAWDAGDVGALSRLTLPPMLDELVGLLAARSQAPNRTEVLTLEAELLGIEDVGAAYLASVEFSGLIRESLEQGAVPFRELWLLASLKDESDSWRLARQQALL